MRSVIRNIWKALVELTGYLLLVIGLILMVIPGPGLIVILAGLTLLATSQIWARDYLHKLKSYLKRLRDIKLH